MPATWIFFFGLFGALWGTVLSQLLCLPIIVVYSVRHGLFNLRRELAAVPAFLLGLGLGWMVALIIAH